MARTGMGEIIARVRQLSNAGTGDYTINGASYWTDDQIEDILDQVRVEVFDETLHPQTEYDTGGTARYYEYRSAHDWYERTTGGTSVWYLRDSTGARIGTANYTTDYQNGRITFAADQAGSVRYLTGRSYDVYAAAALVWESKAAQVADRYDFQADGSRFDASKLVEQYAKQAERMWARSTTAGGLQMHRFHRSDLNANHW